MSMLIIGKAVRELFKKEGLKTSDKTLKALSQELEKLCLKTADNVKKAQAKIVKENYVPKLDALLSDSSKEL